jgi:hypothetical protein
VQSSSYKPITELVRMIDQEFWGVNLLKFCISL